MRIACLPLTVILIVFVVSLFEACNNKPQPARSTSHIRLTDEKLIGYNQGIVKTEDREIEDFLSRYRWEMTLTSTGLRYLIYRKGTGPVPVIGESVSLAYELRLLNGKMIYTSDSMGLKEFRVGYSSVERGLEEGILLLHKGDKAKFIIPSYLAYGLMGDENKIPPGATLVYDITLIDIRQTK